MFWESPLEPLLPLLRAPGNHANELLQSCCVNTVVIDECHWFLLGDHVPELAPKLVALMPNKHPALVWASRGEIDGKDDQRLSDLGIRSVCCEVFVFMEPWDPKAGSEASSQGPASI